MNHRLKFEQNEHLGTHCDFKWLCATMLLSFIYSDKFNLGVKMGVNRHQLHARYTSRIENSDLESWTFTIHVTDMYQIWCIVLWTLFTSSFPCGKYRVTVMNPYHCSFTQMQPVSKSSFTLFALYLFTMNIWHLSSEGKSTCRIRHSHVIASGQICGRCHGLEELKRGMWKSKLQPLNYAPDRYLHMLYYN